MDERGRVGRHPRIGAAERAEVELAALARAAVGLEVGDSAAAASGGIGRGEELRAVGDVLALERVLGAVAGSARFVSR